MKVTTSTFITHGDIKDFVPVNPSIPDNEEMAKKHRIGVVYHDTNCLEIREIVPGEVQNAAIIAIVR